VKRSVQRPSLCRNSRHRVRGGEDIAEDDHSEQQPVASLGQACHF
jgi:hypothetical protein